ncbi:MAG: carbohydrate ABC transporter permease [Anaerolineae bacterium]|nr:carbohydrate ABC transporter permease [Anaerolineae bacterium]
MALFPKVGRTQPRTRLAWWLVVTFLIAGIIIHLIPFYFMVSTSLKPNSEALHIPPTLWPQNPTLGAWNGSRLPMNALRNSFIIAGATLAISLPITSMAAYANSKLQHHRTARWFFLFFIGTLMVPLAVTLIPSFLLTRNFPFPLPTAPLIPGTNSPFPVIRTWNTWWALVLPAAFNAFNFLLFKGYFDTIPNSILHAARVDGGSEFNIFRRIVLPMSIPVYAVAAWFQFNTVWDAFLWPTVVLQDGTLIPLSVRIAGIVNGMEDSGNWNTGMAVALLQSIPVVIVFAITREYLMRGIRLKGLK